MKKTFILFLSLFIILGSITVYAETDKPKLGELPPGVEPPKASTTEYYDSIESILGLPNGMISKWSESVPGIDKVVKIAQYFNVSIDFLATGNDFPTDKEEVILKLLALDDRDISYIEGRIDEKLENSKYKKDATTYVASTAS